jgi:hypothetical protein
VLGFGDKPGDDLACRWHVVDEVGAFAGEDDGSGPSPSASSPSRPCQV